MRAAAGAEDEGLATGAAVPSADGLGGAVDAVLPLVADGPAGAAAAAAAAALGLGAVPATTGAGFLR